MLTPEQLKTIPNAAIKVYAKLEDSIIQDVVRRLKNTEMVMTESAKWQIQMAQESGALYNDIIRKVAEQSGYSEAVVRKTFEEASVRSIRYDNKIYIKYGFVPIELKQSERMLNILKNTLNKTNGELYNLTLTTAKTTQKVFIEALDKAHNEIISGAFNYDTAIRNAVKGITNKGVMVEYPSGYRANIKTAVKRAVMTGVNQTSLKMQEELADEFGIDLVEVTAHGGARLEHAEWQGKVYSRSGKSKKYPKLDEKTGYGTGAGLGGWNCRHNFFPYFEGTERAYTNKELQKLKNE